MNILISVSNTPLVKFDLENKKINNFSVLVPENKLFIAKIILKTKEINDFNYLKFEDMLSFYMGDRKRKHNLK